MGLKTFVSKELTYYVWLGTSLVFLILSYEPKLVVFLGMLLIDFFIFKDLPSRINQNQIGGNTGKAVGYALVGMVTFFVISLGATMVLQGTAILQGTIDLGKPVQSILRHGFATTGLDPENPIFAGSILLTYYTFTFVIVFIETRMLLRLFDWLTKSFNISLNLPPWKSVRMVSVMVFLSWLFMVFHSNVKGVSDNVSLLMTFVFAFISLELGRETREMEAPTYLHFGNNFAFIASKIGFTASKLIT
jgi:hypothetical protein